MKVILAGFNVDTSVLQELQEKAGSPGVRQDVTPEVLSAAYARISRDPRNIDEIRKEAREEVEKSRKSNSTIIFKMGHHSVAEHAVFNLDIIGVSRLAMEELEKFRLSSYTEKSQRYITLDKDFVIPGEIKNTPLEDAYVALIEAQNRAYHTLFGRLKDHVFAKHADLAADPKKHNLLEGWAKEDARYITSLATESQVGLTINARNLELLLRRFASHPLAEVKTLGRTIFSQIESIAPSILIFHQANDRDVKTYPELKAAAASIAGVAAGGKDLPEVKLVEYASDSDDIVLASLMQSVSTLDYSKCRAIVAGLTTEQKKEFIKTAWRNMQFYDSMLREFEYVNLTYEITLSAACFGQLKRHRMSTITTQAYDPGLGVKIPESIKEIGMEKFFLDLVEKTNAEYEILMKTCPRAAPYVLTNAHKRRALIRVNARELYHISRLREDAHAQWDIQNIAHLMAQRAKEVMPIACMLIGGKDKYNQVYESVFGKLPLVTEALLPGSRKIKSA